MFLELFIVFIASFLGTGALNIIFRFLGKRGCDWQKKNS